MKKLLIALLLFFPLTFTAVAKPTQSQTNDLLIQTAPQAQLQLTNAANTYLLKLSHVSHFVIYFTDRPARSTGVISLSEYLKKWNDSANKEATFQKNPPNAAISGIKGFFTDKPLHFVLTLSNPVYNTKDNSLTYVAHSLQGEKAPAAMKFRDAVIFVDDICLSCM